MTAKASPVKASLAKTSRRVGASDSAPSGVRGGAVAAHPKHAKKARGDVSLGSALRDAGAAANVAVSRDAAGAPPVGKAGARHVRASAEGGIVQAGIRDFEQCLSACLGRLPATSDADRSGFAVTQRRLAIDVLRRSVIAMARPAQRELLERFRLFDSEFCRSGSVESSKAGQAARAHDSRAAIATHTFDFADAEPEELGELLESLLALSAQAMQGKLRFLPNQQRKQRGMFYTPRTVVRSVVESALRNWHCAPLPRVCDPSLGGGAFLIGAARTIALLQPAGDTVEVRRAVVAQLHGYDIEPMAIAVTEAALMLWCDGGARELEHLHAQLQPVDALEQRAAGPFDLVIGNPPWVAYAGRATQPMPASRRRWLATEYDAFRGYPTLHACFVELAAKLTPQGRVALLVPSPIADLDGYRPMRRVLTRTHRPAAELVEYGQDAFEGVVQPCFGLIADAAADAEVNDAPFSLIERSGARVGAARLEAPVAITDLAALPRFPRDCFREYGFQTTGQVTRSMLLRAEAPAPPFVYPLLQGRDVTEFTVRAPRLFLNPDRMLLQRLLCRLRDAQDYQRVQFVIRQTAKFTIAAVHSGCPFRNSLLAGFGDTQFTAPVLVGLLNSTLLRSAHLAGQRDARQKTFPQVKVAHLRALPAPLPHAQRARDLEDLVEQLSGRVVVATDRQRLDALVYAWYGLNADAAASVDRFYRERAV